MRKTVSLLLVLLALSLSGRAQTLPLLYNPANPRAMALGGTDLALGADAWAVDGNFAAAALSGSNFALGAAYNRWAPTLGADNRFNLGGWYRSEALAFGLSAKGSFAQETNLSGPAGEPLGTVSPRDLAFALGGAWMAVPGLAFSATARVVSSKLDTQTSGTAFCADLAIQYASDAFAAAVSATNLGASIRYGENTYPLPSLVKGGVAYRSLWADVSAELDYLARSGVMAGIGVEARPLEQPGQPRSWLILRAAYHYGPADKGLPAFGSAGIGLLFEGVELDVSVLFASPTRNGSLSAGLSYSF